MNNEPTLTTPDQVRAKVARYLADAAEIGSDHLGADISHVMWLTHPNVIEGAVLAISDGEGDLFPAELAELHAQHEAGDLSDDRFAFLVAMALYTR